MKNNKLRNREKGLSIINFILVIVIILAGLFVYYMVKGETEISSSETNAIYVSDNTNIKVNTKKYETSNKNNNELLSNNIINGNEQKNTEINYKKFFYNQLSKNAKTMYDTMMNNIESLKSGNGTIEFDIDEKGVENEFQSAWDAITMDHPEVFYIDTTKLSLKTQTVTTFFGAKVTYKYILEPAYDLTYYAKEFDTEEKVVSSINNVEKIANSVIKNANGTTYDKVKYIHDYIINNTSYDENDTPNNGNIYGTLINHEAVCEGYAETMKYLLDKLSIPCVIVYGNGIKEDESSEYHSWNYVKMDDNKWYAIDATWDDPIVIGNGILPKEENYRYFLKGSNDFSSTHVEEHDVSGTGQNFKYPEISEKNY